MKLLERGHGFVDVVGNACWGREAEHPVAGRRVSCQKRVLGRLNAPLWDGFGPKGARLGMGCGRGRGW